MGDFTHIIQLMQDTFSSNVARMLTIDLDYRAQLWPKETLKDYWENIEIAIRKERDEKKRKQLEEKLQNKPSFLRPNNAMKILAVGGGDKYFWYRMRNTIYEDFECSKGYLWKFMILNEYVEWLRVNVAFTRVSTDDMHLLADAVSKGMAAFVPILHPLKQREEEAKR